MDFTHTPAQWNNPGAEPSEELKKNGFKAGYKPPASVFNYLYKNTGDVEKELQEKLSGHAANTSNPHGVTKAQMGLGNADNTADNVKNVLSATKLTTARTINGVSFDGTKNITVADSTKEPAITSSTSSTYWNGLKSFVDFATSVRTAVLTGLSTATSAVITATDTVLSAIGKLQAQITGHKNDVSNPHGVTKAQVGLGSVDNTADSVKNVLSATKLTTPRTINGVSFDGTKNITIVDDIARGAATAAQETANDVLDKTTFVYNCTGIADTTAIATLVNNFFNNGTAMTKYIRVTGTMGVAFTSTYYAMYINSTNLRGAKCVLDFTDCNIPKVSTANRDFLYLTNGISGLHVIGLNVTTTRYGLYTNGNNNSFSHCTITGSNSSAVYLDTSSNNSFDNCKFSGLGTTSASCGIYLIGSSNNTFRQCKMNGGTSSSAYAAHFTSSSNNSFSQCIMTAGSTYSLYSVGGSNNNSFNQCLITGASGIYLIAGNNVSFDQCEITGTSAYGVNLPHGSTGIITFTNCKIVSATYGIYASFAAVNAAIIKLIGCAIKGSDVNYTVHQTSAANTVSWHIMGNSFSYSKIYVDGGEKDASTNTASAYLYMPAYANKFGVTIE